MLVQIQVCAWVGAEGGGQGWGGILLVCLPVWAPGTLICNSLSFSMCVAEQTKTMFAATTLGGGRPCHLREVLTSIMLSLGHVMSLARSPSRPVASATGGAAQRVP